MTELQSRVSFSRAKYVRLLEHVRGGLLDTQTADVVCELIRSGLEKECKFTPDPKVANEVYKRTYQAAKEKLSAEGTTKNQKYMVAWRAKLRERFPGVPTTILYSKSLKEIQEYYDNIKDK